MKQNFLKVAAAFLVFFGLFLMACRKDVPEKTAYKDEIEHLVNEWGFDGSKIEVRDGNLVVEKDIAFPLANFWEDYGRAPQNHPTDSTMVEDRRHFRKSYLVSTYSNSVRWITVAVSPDVHSNWKFAVQDAINEWNALNGKIKFQYVVANSCPANGITVSGVAWGAGTFGLGSNPTSSGNPGPTLQLNTFYNSNVPPPPYTVNNWATATMKKLVAAHELGHCIGFNHTDSFEGTLIQTAYYSCNNFDDPNSVMRSGNLNLGYWNGFSSCDVVAFKKLYGW